MQTRGMLNTIEATLQVSSGGSSVAASTAVTVSPGMIQILTMTVVVAASKGSQRSIREAQAREAAIVIRTMLWMPR